MVKGKKVVRAAEPAKVRVRATALVRVKEKAPETVRVRATVPAEESRSGSITKIMFQAKTWNRTSF